MAIYHNEAWLLSKCAVGNSSPDKVDFSRTLTLGRQMFALSRFECEEIFDNILKLSEIEKTQFYADLQKSTAEHFPNSRYSEPFLKLLQKGEERIIDSLDYSDYENATIIHDITVPVKSELKNKYTCVIDGGLLEHVFDYPTALKNAMDMVAPGGHIILATPGNNFFGHGFYQLSPELFYSVLCKENGFTNTRVYLNDYLALRNKWYLVENPRSIHARTEVSPKWRNVSIYVVSTKVGEVPDKIVAYQSDYEDIWASKQYESGRKLKTLAMLRRIYRKLPPIIGRPLLRLYYKITYRKKFNAVFKPCKL